jgi:hypothetical protein
MIFGELSPQALLWFELPLREIAVKVHATARRGCIPFGGSTYGAQFLTIPAVMASV